MSNKATRQQRTRAERALKDAKTDRAFWSRKAAKETNPESRATYDKAVRDASRREAQAQRDLNR